MPSQRPINTSAHILNTSSNLLGLCFIVLTSLHVLKVRQATIIDELTAVAIVFLMTSCILSFLSIRNASKSGVHYERVADVFFLFGLICIFLTTMLVVLGIID